MLAGHGRRWCKAAGVGARHHSGKQRLSEARVAREAAWRGEADGVRWRIVTDEVLRKYTWAQGCAYVTSVWDG